MKNVLIPTDLSVASLYPIHEICQRAGNEKINIYVIHTLEMPSGIVDLLFSSEKKPYKLISPKFLEALEMLREKYTSTIALLSFEFIYGNSTPLLRNYMHHRNVESIWMLNDFPYSGGLPQSASCISTLTRCKLPLEYVPQGSVGEHRILTTLLYNTKKMPA
jgi:hypothetical protein